ncbi:hypothetical protein PR048_005494 [Dryococelus australis]|uniref:Uncharacterized protein n=1 Tax=Dryococelus australis TaxID=614101 RepID=A0ABQ9IAI2_9NEOP|nr:hypothetical protein PR048_005494 [Dryococelus australis]
MGDRHAGTVKIPFTLMTNRKSALWKSGKSAFSPPIGIRFLVAANGEGGYYYFKISGGVAPGFSHVVIVSDDAAGPRVFSVISLFPPFHSCAAPYTLRFTLIGSQRLDVLRQRLQAMEEWRCCQPAHHSVDSEDIALLVLKITHAYLDLGRTRMKMEVKSILSSSNHRWCRYCDKGHAFDYYARRHEKSECPKKPSRVVFQLHKLGSAADVCPAGRSVKKWNVELAAELHTTTEDDDDIGDMKFMLDLISSDASDFYHSPIASDLIIKQPTKKEDSDRLAAVRKLLSLTPEAALVTDPEVALYFLSSLKVEGHVLTSTSIIANWIGKYIATSLHRPRGQWASLMRGFIRQPESVVYFKCDHDLYVIHGHGVKVEVVCIQYGRWEMPTKMLVTYQDGGLQGGEGVGARESFVCWIRKEKSTKTHPSSWEVGGGMSWDGSRGVRGGVGSWHRSTLVAVILSSGATYCSHFSLTYSNMTARSDPTGSDFSDRTLRVVPGHGDSNAGGPRRQRIGPSPRGTKVFEYIESCSNVKQHHQELQQSLKASPRTATVFNSIISSSNQSAERYNFPVLVGAAFSAFSASAVRVWSSGKWNVASAYLALESRWRRGSETSGETRNGRIPGSDHAPLP